MNEVSIDKCTDMWWSLRHCYDKRKLHVIMWSIIRCKVNNSLYTVYPKLYIYRDKSKIYVLTDNNGSLGNKIEKV